MSKLKFIFNGLYKANRKSSSQVLNMIKKR
jgi:hypothetical protein